ncbi:amidase family protein [Raineyella fluvialis]|uniref:Amidase n=1 Tax=Raineyella fluvialis TaxID=2662261 RepID=A0A5Q2F6N6_9ACTN|nr:amidase family protein [Raineyella fluvialis]QGF22640.1 amidase [Raineyella fluvialis]
MTETITTPSITTPSITSSPTRRTIQDWLDLPIGERKELAVESLAAARRATEALNTYISVLPVDGLELAEEGELACVPYAVKDNVDVRGLPTTAGTPALEGHYPRIDASVVRALRDEGAVAIGKANMHELAFGLTSNNGRFGPARNPYDPERVSGGSSGGSAAAVAAGTVPFALGTDTGASVTTPSGYCGVVGFRPSTGRYAGDGMVHLTWTRDAIGIHANTVTDVRTVDGVITRTSVLPTETGPRGLTIGIPTEFFDDLDPQVAAAVDEALAALRAEGVRFVETGVPDAMELASAGFSMVFYETPINLRAYLNEAEEAYRGLTLAQIAEQTASPDVTAMLRLMRDQPISAEQYEADAGVRNRLRRLYQQTFAEHDLDAILYPTTPNLPPLLGSDDTIMHNGTRRDMFPTATRNVAPGGLAGAPQLTLPLSRQEGTLPIAVTIEGGIGTDERLLAIGEALHPLI